MVRRSNVKFRRVNINQNINPEISVTFKHKNRDGVDLFEIFNEVIGQNIGTFRRERVLESWTVAQLNYVKKHGTTNFVRVGAWG